MRKFGLLLSILLFLSATFCFGQTDWGPWTQHPCFKGIFFRGQKAYFSKGLNKWWWNFQIHNRYNRTVEFSWLFYDEADGPPKKTDSRHTFKSNEIYSNASSSGERLAFLVDGVCFSFKDVNGTLVHQCSTKPTTTGYSSYYAECDDGTPNFKTAFEVPNNPNTNPISTPTNNTTYNSNTQTPSSRPSYPNNTQSTTVSPNYQSNSNNQVKPQQQSLTEDVKQLATGISGLMASIKADKERRLAEEKQAAIAKRNEERQTSNDADNGVYDAQIKMAEKYFGESRYNLAQDYYFQAFQNKTVNNDKRNDVLDELITTLSLLGKKKEIFELVDYITTNKIVNYNVVEILNFLRLNCGEFCPDYLNCNDSAAIINVIKEIKPNTNSWFQLPLKEKDALFAYYQVTGKYEKYGIPKDEKQGLKALEKIIDSKYIFSQQECAYYYLGLIYLNGASTIDVNEKKALKYFKKGYDRPEKVYQLAPAYSTYDARKAYFNYHLLNYIQIAALYSKSEDKEDSELGRKMLKAFYTYYKAMIPQSDMEYFKDYVTK